jgi:hypothetical protein
VILASILVVVVLAGERHLGSAFAGDLILLIRQLLFPFLFGFTYFAIRHGRSPANLNDYFNDIPI